MRDSDLPRADELRRIAGWNQRPADWQRFLDLSPEGCFVALSGDVVTGTVTTIRYGRKVGWIGMLLVHPDFRGGGIGKALLIRAVEHLESEKIPSIKLDATPLGEGLYRKMGFQDEWALTRYKVSVFSTSDQGSDETFELTAHDLARVTELDGEAFGVKRPELFESLLSSAQQSLAIVNEGGLQAFGLRRSGSVADYLGPVVARTGSSATTLIRKLASGNGRPVYWDVPVPNKSAISLAQHLGFSPERPLLRMYLGRNDDAGDVSKYFAIADPSLG